MAKKFVVSDNNLKIASAIDNHYELVKDKNTCKGGGLWHVDDNEKFVLLYSSSHDFGYTSIESIKEVLNNSYFPRWENYRLLYSNQSSLSGALLSNEFIANID